MMVTIIVAASLVREVRRLVLVASRVFGVLNRVDVCSFIPRLRGVSCIASQMRGYPRIIQPLLFPKRTTNMSKFTGEIPKGSCSGSLFTSLLLALEV